MPCVISGIAKRKVHKHMKSLEGSLRGHLRGLRGQPAAGCLRSCHIECNSCTKAPYIVEKEYNYFGNMAHGNGERSVAVCFQVLIHIFECVFLKAGDLCLGDVDFIGDLNLRFPFKKAKLDDSFVAVVQTGESIT